LQLTHASLVKGPQLVIVVVFLNVEYKIGYNGICRTELAYRPTSHAHSSLYTRNFRVEIRNETNELWSRHGQPNLPETKFLDLILRVA